VGDEKGWLRGVKLTKMELGPADDSGRRRPVPIQGSDYVLPLDVAIIAVGTGSNPLVQSTTPDIETRKGGYIAVDEKNLKTSKRGVFAAGDIVTGAATVILAMGAGRTAARGIDEFLKTGQW
jgi:glutamate synthase (NADPH/NADH) small chain